MNCIGTYDGTIFYNPANKFCIISVKTADQSVPAEARSNRRYKDHLIRFTAVGYEIPRTDAVELELDGEWAKGKYGVQLQVEQWREIVPRTKNGVEGYLASGLIKGIGPKTAADIVERFGVDTLDILEHQPERLLEIRGITENKLEDIKASYAENRMLQGIMTLLAPFKITPKTALKIYQYFGPTSVEILEKSPFELCQISGFGFRRVDAIVQKSGGDLHDPMRIKGAVFCALDEGKSKRGHTSKNLRTIPVTNTQLIMAKISMLFIFSITFCLISTLSVALFCKLFHVGMVYGMAYKIFMSLIFGVLIVAASLPIVFLIICFNKSFLLSILLAFFYSIFNWGILGTVGTSISAAKIAFLNSFPVICVMNWTSGLMMDHLQKDNLLPEAYAIVPTTCHTIFIMAITVILSLWLIIRFYKKWTR